MQIFIGGFLAMEIYFISEFYKKRMIEMIVDPILDKGH